MDAPGQARRDRRRNGGFRLRRPTKKPRPLPGPFSLSNRSVTDRVDVTFAEVGPVVQIRVRLCWRENRVVGVAESLARRRAVDFAGAVMLRGRSELCRRSRHQRRSFRQMAGYAGACHRAALCADPLGQPALRAGSSGRAKVSGALKSSTMRSMTNRRNWSRGSLASSPKT